MQPAVSDAEKATPVMLTVVPGSAPSGGEPEDGVTVIVGPDTFVNGALAASAAVTPSTITV